MVFFFVDVVASLPVPVYYSSLRSPHVGMGRYSCFGFHGGGCCIGRFDDSDEGFVLAVLGGHDVYAGLRFCPGF